ncbi:MAG: zinc carboxypeptidase [Candidatus Aminicenantes bacterium]|nr:zinc carboxypeptidase [Candidatus Aminicenantes bacterium]
MYKTAIRLILLLVLFTSIDSGITEKWGSGNVLAGINVVEYEKILPVYGPLDRLYCSGDICYFILPKYEINAIMNDGFKIDSIHKLPERRSGIKTTYYDINGSYHNYSETLELLTNLSNQYPEHASLFSIGESVEGRGLHVLKISDNVSEDEDEPNIYIIGCHHAREWISVEIPLLFAQYILENMGSDPEVRKAVNGTQIYIMPILNPDGLEFSIINYRYWRKNRKYNGDLSWGVDLNRNYSYMWGYDDSGSSPSEISEIFRGTGPFSEPETYALKEFMIREVPAGVLSYHNFSQLILYPWGYTNDPPEDFEALDKIGKRMRDLIFEVNGREYVPGSGSYNIYTTNGGMVDWAYGTFRVPAYTIELPPEYSFEGGFFTSNEEIGRTFAENLPAMLYFTNYFINNDFLEMGTNKED